LKLKALAVSPAKVILFGEHFVVGGNSAISMSIDLPTTVTVEDTDQNHIQIKSEDLEIEAVFTRDGKLARSSGRNAETTLRPVFQAADFTLKKLKNPGQGLKISVKSKVPIGMGLGSSAATAVGTVTGITTLHGLKFSKDDVFEAAYSLEKMVHGHPSGVDQATVTYGGLISYQKGRVNAKINVAKPPLMIIGNTGKRRSTGEFVGRVTRLRETQPNEYGKIASEAQIIADKAAEWLTAGQPEKLGALMNENQRLLESVGVSSPELETLISAARQAGALGAKLTGGGGGGCMIALVEDSTHASVSQAIEHVGGKIVPGQFTPDGVRASLYRV
jgi:mevalonate kinase